MTTTSLWGAGFAFATLGEILTPAGMVGGLLILVGCALGNLSPEKPPKSVDEAPMALPLVGSPDSSYLRERSMSSDSYRTS
jgi:hypothetical protein